MHDDLMEQVAAEENLRRALAAVKRNRGAAGIDAMTTDQLESHFRRHGEKIRAKLLAGRWTPSPGAAGRNTQTARRQTAVGHPDGDGPAAAAGSAASFDADL